MLHDAPVGSESTPEPDPSPTPEVTFISRMSVFNYNKAGDCIHHTWEAAERNRLYGKNSDGNEFPTGLLFRLCTGGSANSITTSYLLRSYYTKFEGVFSLEYRFRTDANVFMLRILGDDVLLHETTTAGVVPEEISLDISGVNVLSMSLSVNELETSPHADFAKQVRELRTCPLVFLIIGNASLHR